ncbi:MAG: hypothetical protein ABIQ54_04305 [Gammaproteobacteria bacterium]
MPPLSITLHGVFMEIAGLGVLLSGASGAGKGELALELITRGHRLIADDAPEFSLSIGKKLTGICPGVLQDFLEVCILGVLNVRYLFGDPAICPEASLDLIVRLEQSDKPALRDIGNPLAGTRNVLGIGIPEIILQILPGRNLAVLVECLARNHRLQLQGCNTARDFGLLQQQTMANLGP